MPVINLQLLFNINGGVCSIFILPKHSDIILVGSC